MVALPGPDAPILVAVDFSPDSEAAFDWAVAAARAYGAPLLALHVVHDPTEAPGYYARAAADELARLEQVATKLLAEFVARARERLGPSAAPEIRGQTAVGLPVTRILEVARQEHAALIVMGGRGRTALSDVLLGSKVERVARLSPVPVTVVRGPEAPPESTR